MDIIMKFNEDLDLDGYSISGISEAKDGDGNIFLTTANLDEVVFGDIELSNYYTKSEVDGILSSDTFNAATATKLETTRTIQTNLASTYSASFDGTSNITPGVTGILSVGNGGTGNISGLPASHAVTTDTYGVGTSTDYGHLKLLDSTTSSSSTEGGYAATPKSVSDVNNKIVYATATTMGMIRAKVEDGVLYIYLSDD